MILNKIFTRKFITFILTGILNTFVGYLFYSCALFFTGNKPVSLAVDYILSIFFNFKTYSALVFNSNDNGRIFRFVAVYVLVYFMNVGILSLLCRIFSINGYIGQGISLMIVPFIMFFLMDAFVFHSREKSSVSKSNIK